MPLGIVTDNDLEKELERLNGGKPKSIAIIVDKKDLGRPDGVKNTPDGIRKVVAEELLNGSDKQEVIDLFKVSESSASAYKNGATSTATYDLPSKSLNGHVNSIKERIATKARSRLINALNNITPDKLADANLKDLSQVAKDMSAVIKNVEPRDEDEKAKNVQFIFFAPKIREESDFTVIDVANE